MSLLVNTAHRTDDVEIMDDFNINGTILRDSLDKLATINKWLGGNSVTLDGLKKVLKNHDKEQPLTIIDLGCGGGDILREVSTFGKKEGYVLKLIGVDANADAIEYAKELSKEHTEINFMQCDIFSEEFKNLKYDVVLSTLFLHHFKEKQLEIFLGELLKNATLGIVVNDLHRHRMAYYLFKIVSIGIKNQMIVEDGLTSVLRGFKRKELEGMSNKQNVKPLIIWKWAFRYQWILKR